MRWVWAALLLLGLSEAKAQEQQDVIQALRQQREEALDKVANAYVTIMKLQRELDKMKADQNALHATPAPPSSK
jgi:DNA-binding protein H-NS